MAATRSWRPSSRRSQRITLREHFSYQLLLALYRSERQADALDAHRQARRELAVSAGPRCVIRACASAVARSLAAESDEKR